MSITTEAPPRGAIEPLLSTEEVANILGISERSVMRMIADGRLKKVKDLGRSVRIRAAAVRAFTDDQ
jgi:excisionase family DNA binding protein